MLASPKPHAVNGHYKYFIKFNSLWSICIASKNNHLRGAVIKAESGSPTGLKRHISTHQIYADLEPDPKQAIIAKYSIIKLVPDSLQKDIAILVAINLTPMLIDKIRKTCTTFKAGKKRDELKRIVQRNDPTQVVTISLDYKTRWDSILAMSNCFIKLFLHLHVHFAEQNEDFPFNTDDKAAVIALASVLEYVEIAIKKMGKADANLMTADIAMNGLFRNLNGLSASDQGNIFTKKNEKCTH